MATDQDTPRPVPSSQGGRPRRSSLSSVAVSPGASAAQNHTPPDFPHVDLSILTDREALILQLHYADGWSLRRISRALADESGTSKSSVSRQHFQALRRLYDAKAYCLGYGGWDTNSHIEIEALGESLGEQEDD